MLKSPEPNANRVVKELRSLLEHDPTEEEIHQFLKTNVFIFRPQDVGFSGHFVEGTISKFPVTPDRVPDFTSVMLNLERSQKRSLITFIELKKPGTALYTHEGRMSKDLNDAWMQSVETIRLIAQNLRDCLRRIVKILNVKQLQDFEAHYNSHSGHDKEFSDYLPFEDIPLCKSVIIIGRRSSLGLEDLLRTRELSAVGPIHVITYDTIMDILEGQDNRAFHRAFWYLMST